MSQSVGGQTPKSAMRRVARMHSGGGGRAARHHAPVENIEELATEVQNFVTSLRVASAAQSTISGRNCNYPPCGRFESTNFAAESHDARCAWARPLRFRRCLQNPIPASIVSRKVSRRSTFRGGAGPWCPCRWSDPLTSIDGGVLRHAEYMMAMRSGATARVGKWSHWPAGLVV